jgi:hypothetical protein
VTEKDRISAESIKSWFEPILHSAGTNHPSLQLVARHQPQETTMNLKAILAGAAVLMVSGPALAQSTAPTTPGAPSTDQKPTPPADVPAATPPNTSDDAAKPDANNTATSPTAPGSPSMSSSSGGSWDAKKCADARKKGERVDPANCPATPKPKR